MSTCGGLLEHRYHCSVQTGAQILFPESVEGVQTVRLRHVKHYLHDAMYSSEYGLRGKDSDDCMAVNKLKMMVKALTEAN